MVHLLDSLRSGLSAWLSGRGFPSYREAQIRRWLFQRRALAFDAMSDLPAELRSALAENFELFTTTVIKRHQATDGTEKLLLGLADNNSVECVLLRDGIRRTVCISTQVGCAMGCVFCASGLSGVKRNLSSGEMVEQMLRLQQLLPDNERLSHIVVMGMGEPLANLDELLPALELAHRKDGLGISARRVTVSTVGLPKGILRLAESGCQYHLAVSLHAPDDGLRSRIVPANKSAGLAEILAAADRYFEASGRRLTFEYVLLSGENDGPEHAARLAELLKGRAALLNVIPYNPVKGLPFRTPSPAAQKRFRALLESAGVNVQFRMRRGDDISAACGQLRRSENGR